MINPAYLEWVAHHQDGYEIYKDQYDDNAPLYAGTEPHNAKPWRPKQDEPWKRLALIRQIVSQHQYKVIDGMVMDAMTARVILQVYEALGQENKDKYIQYSADKMANIAWELVK